MKDRKYVYMVQMQYSTDDYDGVETLLFETREKALKAFYNLIEMEKRESWIQDGYLDGEVRENYELDSNIDNIDACDLWWNFKKTDDYYYHTFIDLRQIEVE